MYICLCNAVTDRDVRCCVEQGARSVSELRCELGIGASCGRCVPAAEEILQEQKRESLPA